MKHRCSRSVKTGVRKDLNEIRNPYESIDISKESLQKLDNLYDQFSKADHWYTIKNSKKFQSRIRSDSESSINSISDINRSMSN